MPGAAPKPRKRSIRMAPLAGNWLGQPRRLAAVLIGGTKIPGRKLGALAGAEHSGGGAVGPQNAAAVGRPQPCRQGARCVPREARIAFDLPLEFRLVHRPGVARAG